MFFKEEVQIMRKKLVAYFSASGVTRSVAQRLAAVAEADLFEIQPVTPYTKADLDWTDKSSRSSIEMQNPLSRPAIAKKFDNMDEYEVIFLGFPIWWYIAPTIVNAFLESYDFSGKTIVLFATSGGSGFGKTAEVLKPCAAGARLLSGRVLNGVSDREIRSWVDSLDL